MFGALVKEIAAVDHLFYALFTFFRSSLTSPLLARAPNDRKKMCVAKTISSGRPKNEKVPLAVEIAQYSSSLHCLLSFVVLFFESRWPTNCIAAHRSTFEEYGTLFTFPRSDADGQGIFRCSVANFHELTLSVVPLGVEMPSFLTHNKARPRWCRCHCSAVPKLYNFNSRLYLLKNNINFHKITLAFS